MKISKETIIWAYRLFLDREPENEKIVASKLRSLSNTQDVRREFLNSDEYLSSNPTSPILSLSGCEPPLLIEKVDNLQDLFVHIQDTWEYLGNTEPHWSVLTWDKFLSSGEGTQKQFYDTGEYEADRLFNTLNRNGIDHGSLKTCLEFGCGLGRVTLWLAKKYETVIGYDISSSHLSLARQYFDEKGYKNITLYHLKNLSDLSTLPKVDLIFSVIVLQHNPPPIIRLIVRELIRALNPGGVAFFQVPTYRLGYKFILQEYLSNEVENCEMESHVLTQKEVFDIVYNEQGEVLEVLEDACVGLTYGVRSNTFVVRKKQ
jgi:SAM-dependent methyltransferase